MAAAWTRRGDGVGRRRWRREDFADVERAATFAAALAVSVALHAWLWTALPKWTVGRMAPTRVRPAPETRPMELGDVERQPRAASDWEDPPRFRPEDPAAFAAVEARQNELFGEWLDEASAETWEAPAPMDAGVPAGGEAPDAPGLDEQSAFRQEIVEIEEKRAADELAALPRRVDAAAGRVQGAPDITLATDPDSIAAAALAAAAAHGGGGPGGFGRGGAGKGGAYGAFGGGVAAEAEESAPAEPAPPEEAAMEAAVESALEETFAAEEAERAEVLDEVRGDITEAAPVEQLLSVRTGTWADKAEGWLYFEAEIARAGEEALPVLPKDVLLVLDRSWSINPSKFDYFKDAMVEFLRSLRQGDRVNVMRYSENAEFCFDGWAPATEENLTMAARYVQETRREGKTDLYASLRTMLDVPRDPRRPALAVLFTDGRATAGVLENSDIISRFSRLNGGGLSVFTAGAGDNVNRFLLDMLGQFNRGGTWYREDRAKLPEAMRQAARGLSRPVLADLKWRLSTGAEAEVFPEDLTHLYLDRPLRLTGRCPLAGAEGAVLRVEGVSAGKTFDMVFPLDWSEAEDGGEGIRREWVAQKIYSLLHDDLESKNPATQAEILRLSQTYKVPLP